MPCTCLAGLEVAFHEKNREEVGRKRRKNRRNVGKKVASGNKKYENLLIFRLRIKNILILRGIRTFFGKAAPSSGQNVAHTHLILVFPQ